MINIPQRAQAVNGYSPVKAGLALLALLLSSPSATAVSGVLTSSFKVPPVYLILIGAVLQVIGVGLTISLPTTGGPFPKQQYAFEVIMGLGFGLILATVLTLAQLVCDEKDIGMSPAPISNLITLTQSSGRSSNGRTYTSKSLGRHHIFSNLVSPYHSQYPHVAWEKTTNTPKSK